MSNEPIQPAPDESTRNWRDGEWISVDTPPFKSGYYLVYDENTAGESKVELYRYSRYNDSWYWGSDCFHPQFWMPLPKPPCSNAILSPKKTQQK